MTLSEARDEFFAASAMLAEEIETRRRSHKETHARWFAAWMAYGRACADAMFDGVAEEMLEHELTLARVVASGIADELLGQARAKRDHGD